MPRVKYTESKGLVTSQGRGFDITESGVACNIRRNVITVSATTRTLTVAESGSIVILAGGSASTVTLPDVAAAGAGWWCTFYAGTAQTHIVDTGADNILQGAVLDGSASTTVAYAPITNQQKITLVSPRIGDRIDVVCDGTNFHTTVISSQTPTLATS